MSKVTCILKPMHLEFCTVYCRDCIRCTQRKLKLQTGLVGAVVLACHKLKLIYLFYLFLSDSSSQSSPRWQTSMVQAMQQLACFCKYMIILVSYCFDRDCRRCSCMKALLRIQSKPLQEMANFYFCFLTAFLPPNRPTRLFTSNVNSDIYNTSNSWDPLKTFKAAKGFFKKRIAYSSSNLSSKKHRNGAHLVDFKGNSGRR